MKLTSGGSNDTEAKVPTTSPTGLDAEPAAMTVTPVEPVPAEQIGVGSRLGTRLSVIVLVAFFLLALAGVVRGAYFAISDGVLHVLDEQTGAFASA